MTNSINSNKSKSNFIRVEKNYRKNGFVIIKNFINKKIIQDIRNELTNKKKK